MCIGCQRLSYSLPLPLQLAQAASQLERQERVLAQQVQQRAAAAGAGDAA